MTRIRSSRRRFLKLVAGGSAAALAAPALALAAETKKKKGKKVAPPAKKEPADSARTLEIEKGIGEQKDSLKKTIEKLRGYELPTNSEQAFVFAPLAARKERRP